MNPAGTTLVAVIMATQSAAITATATPAMVSTARRNAVVLNHSHAMNKNVKAATEVIVAVDSVMSMDMSTPVRTTRQK